ncbi:MAG: peptide deformylase [Paludibacteraceae bacterium]|nr:peptide deformylase [Candidatus Physcocola equi]MCQ2233835.1 peptide deformylase [Paludibacteraceae bacterium]
MIYPIYVYGMPVLRKVAKEVPKDYENLPQLAEDMFKTMYRAEGVGLAAPQIGLSLRMFVIDIEILADDEHPEFKGAKRVFVNPEIIEMGDELKAQDEGCLSLPGISESVKRATMVRVKYFDENWNEHEEVFTGFFAKAVQHEYEHLDGKLFIDNISPVRRTMNRGRLQAMLKGKINCRYSVKTV